MKRESAKLKKSSEPFNYKNIEKLNEHGELPLLINMAVFCK